MNYLILVKESTTAGESLRFAYAYFDPFYHLINLPTGVNYPQEANQ